MAFSKACLCEFHEAIYFSLGVPDNYIEAVAQVMVSANWHTYQVLTKRSERVSELLNGRLRFAGRSGEHLVGRKCRRSKIWECQESTTCRRAPAAVRFLSVEPLLEDLGDIDLSGIHWVIVGGEKRKRRTPHGEGMGDFATQTMQSSRCEVFLQAVGRRP